MFFCFVDPDFRNRKMKKDRKIIFRYRKIDFPISKIGKSVSDISDIGKISDIVYVCEWDDIDVPEVCIADAT